MAAHATHYKDPRVRNPEGEGYGPRPVNPPSRGP